MSRHRPHLLRTLALLLAAASTGCSEKGPAPSLLLVIDGISIQLDEVEPYVRFLDEFVPEGGRKTKVQRALEEQLIPLRLAQRAFPNERASLLAQAQTLCGVATNAIELEQHAKALEHQRRAHFARLHAKLPIAMFLFDPLKLGSVSPPIEVPEGWSVVAGFDMRQGALALDDSVDALQVAFYTHGGRDWSQWLDAEKLRVADKVTYVHPDYVHALPDWVHPPKQP